MRIILLRVLIGWWMIPVVWLIMMPLFCVLLFDVDRAIQECKGISHDLWY